MSVSLVVGCPVWERAWALPTWFDSVEANCDPADTGLCFSIPPTDMASRAVIAERSKPFAWCEILRDPNDPADRIKRQKENHESLAQARNQILRVVQGVQPEFYLSWDCDLFIEPGVIPEMRKLRLPIATVWTWLNRAAPTKRRHYPDADKPKWIDVLSEPAMCATAMKWDQAVPGRAYHVNPAHWHEYAHGLWEVDVALAIKLMGPQVYNVASYAPHPYGEDMPFNWMLEQRGIPRYSYGESIGLHLALDKAVAQNEIKTPYPAIMKLAEQIPLAASYNQMRDPTMVMIGYFPIREGEDV